MSIETYDHPACDGRIISALRLGTERFHAEVHRFGMELQCGRFIIGVAWGLADDC